MHLEYITSVVDLTEMYSKGNLWCVGGGGGSSEDNDYMKTHFS